MSRPIVIVHKRLRTPPGCEDYLTRRQAAALLGFASEYKIRELEKQGLLRSVRGPMRAAFYPRPDVLALKARLAQAEVAQDLTDDWSDADLIALLAHPKSTGHPRTALDLVTETRISIERAEKVFAFFSKGAKPEATPPPVWQAASDPPSPTDTDSERRGHERLTRDRLIRDLRDPDPHVRLQAFERLREGRS
jgi:hypothetical protein